MTNRLLKEAMNKTRRREREREYWVVEGSNFG